jgi:hypothetical protein
MTHLLLTATLTPSVQNFFKEPENETDMDKDILVNAGIHFNELNELWMLDPEVTQQTTELKEE